MPPFRLILAAVLFTVLCAVGTFSLVNYAYGEDDAWDKKPPMYINPLHPKSEDHIVIDPEGIWAGFGEDNKSVKTMWALVDYQRNIGGVRSDVTTEGGKIFSSCIIFEVNNVEYLRILNDPKLVVHQTFIVGCEGIEKWIDNNRD